MKDSIRILALLIIAIVGLSIVAYAALSVFSAQLPQYSAARGYIAVVKLDGSIAYSSSLLNIFGSTLNPEDVSRLLESVRGDPLAKAVVLLVNSPGGSAVASRDVFEAVRKLSNERVVVAYIKEYGTSGAYLISLPTHYIIAEPDSLTGSIGAISVVIVFSDLLSKLGIKAYTFKSGMMKDIGSPYRNMTSEEVAILQEIVNSTFNTFRSEVLKYRGGKIASNKLDEVFSGRPFTGSQAVEIGLIDGVGGLDDAIAKAREIAGLPKDTPIKYIKPPKPGLIDLIYRLIGSSSSKQIRLNYEVITMWPLPVDLEEYTAK